MNYNPDIHRRRSIRLRGYDYSAAGAFFVTICTVERESIFGEVAGDGMRLNELGTALNQCWRAITIYFAKQVNRLLRPYRCRPALPPCR